MGQALNFNKDLLRREKEIAVCAQAMGLKQLIVAVNYFGKDESIGERQDSKRRFLELKAVFSDYLKKIGYANVPFVPIDAIRFENVAAPDTQLRELWQDESGVLCPDLYRALRNLRTPKRLLNKPMRMSIDRIHKISGVGFVVSGKLVTGKLAVN
mmetsp:Transcript_28896/g.35704  ORF Transcript_28896/g.35704 Transcript_28896/m.35704 type:complete len:155 (+) Transcript_28896:403-867(+)